MERNAANRPGPVLRESRRFPPGNSQRRCNSTATGAAGNAKKSNGILNCSLLYIMRPTPAAGCSGQIVSFLGVVGPEHLLVICMRQIQCAGFNASFERAATSFLSVPAGMHDTPFPPGCTRYSKLHETAGVERRGRGRSAGVRAPRGRNHNHRRPRISASGVWQLGRKLRDQLELVRVVTLGSQPVENPLIDVRRQRL